MTVWVVICEESQEERARVRRLPREADFFGLMRFEHSSHAYFAPGSDVYLFGAQGASMSDPALLRACARFASRAEAEEALGANRNDSYLYHFVELTADHVALLDLAEVE